jgi:hypothetical protein
MNVEPLTMQCDHYFFILGPYPQLSYCPNEVIVLLGKHTEER